MKSKTYFIGCMHFGHKNILKIDNRPFSNIDEHDNALIKNWNDVVTNNDKVYILGDMFYKTTTQHVHNILKQLNGKKYYIFGNHENLLKQNEFSKYFEQMTDYLELQITDDTNKTWNVILSHYPMLAFNKGFRDNSIHLFSHVHMSSEYENYLAMKLFQKLNNPDPFMQLSVNTGVMLPYMNFKPQPIEHLITTAITENKKMIQLNHSTFNFDKTFFDKLK